MDGIGTLYLLGHFLKYASKAFEEGSRYILPKFGDEWKRLSPPLHVAAGLPPAHSKETERLFNQVVAHNESILKEREVLAMPFKRGCLMPRKHQRVEIRLSRTKTEQMLSACKALGATVTHTYHAAIAIALSRFQPRQDTERKARYVSYGLINMRDRCQEPFNTLAHAASVYHSISARSLAIDLTIPAASNTAEDEQRLEEHQRTLYQRVLEEVKVFYHSMRNDQGLLRLTPLLLNYVTPSWPEDTSLALEVPHPNEKSSVSI